MSHFLFFVSRNTQSNKATFVVLLMSTYRRLASLNDVHLTTIYVVHLNVACSFDLGVVYYTSTFFTALVLFDTGCRLVATRRSTLHF